MNYTCVIFAPELVLYSVSNRLGNNITDLMHHSVYYNNANMDYEFQLKVSAISTFLNCHMYNLFTLIIKNIFY